MQEYIYYNKQNLDFPLSEKILVTNNMIEYKDSDFIVSNTNLFNAELVADEIDFYIRNSQDTVANKIKNVEKLYDLNEVRFDNAQDMTFSQDVQKKVLLICDESWKKEFIKKIVSNEFNLFHINENILKSIDGSIGNLNVIIDDENKDITLNVDQIIWFDMKDEGKKQSGCFDPLETSIDDVLAQVRANISNYEYRKFLTYDKTICQYHERREETCAKCVDVCPTTTIIKDDKNKHLHFSQIDCHGCGGCISVCPSGALDYTPSNRESIYSMSKFFDGHIPLIVPHKMNISSLEVALKENVLPFKIEGEKFLHESTLLTILQESGSQVVFYTDFLSKGTIDSISILNQIYQAKYQKDAIIVAMNKEELIDALEKADFIDGAKYKLNDMSLRKRENFAIRLSKIVGEYDYGEVQTGPNVHYAKVEVNEANCTLCLSCVGACNVNAIFADAKDNTLRLNPSLCTSCGYCEASCPEADCLTIKRDVIELQPMWFKENILAKDSLFACVECGKEFATTKSVEKIAKIMSPIFAKDPIKERTLYCCETCKPKIMMKSYMENKDAYNNPQGVSL